MKLAVWLVRLLLGGTFTISGLAKMIDPEGSVNKITDYLAAWGLADAFAPGPVLLAACALAMVEFITGFLLATGSLRRAAPVAAAAIMAFMLPLSLYIMLFNPVEDCGCFGDFIIISNTATFWKNVALSAMVVFLLIYNRRALCLFRPWVQWMQLTVAVAYAAAIGLWGYHVQPLIDFRPWPEGSCLLADQDGSLTYVYRSPQGQLTEFDDQNLPDEDEGWEFVETRGTVDDHGSLTLLDADGSDVTDDVIGATPEQMLLLMPDIASATAAASYTANELAGYMQQRFGPDAFIALADADSAAVARWRDISMANYPIYFAEARTLKTIARGHSSLIMLRGDTILFKRTFASVDPVPVVRQGLDPEEVYATRGPQHFRQITIIALLLLAAIWVLGEVPHLPAMIIRSIRSLKK